MIPKKIHFITGLKEDFGGKPFGFCHYMAIRSAINLNPDFKIFVYYKYKPSGPYWNIIKEYVTEVLVEPPSEIFGNKLEHFAHQADVLRLEILLREGGIYLDTDTICCKPFGPILQDKVIMGLEGFKFGFDAWNSGERIGLCNAVIIAPKGAEFLSKWLESYSDFDGSNWNQHSVFRPAELARQFPSLITVHPPERFFWPIWNEDGIRSLFVECHHFPESISIHLWESISWHHISMLNYNIVKSINTSYNLIARQYIETDGYNLKAIADATDNASSFITTLDVAREEFSSIYSRGEWGKGSGVGSAPETSRPYVDFLTQFIEINRVGSIVDFGCGDWQFSQFINWSQVRYFGFDVVGSVIRENILRFAKTGISFHEFENFDAIPKVDLVVCKEVFQHLPNHIVISYVNELRKKCRFMLITNDETPTDIVNNEIIIGKWRPIRLDREPFSIKGAYVTSYKSVHEGLVKSVFLVVGELD